METELINLLHDHHKDTFAYIRERERQRDRLFLIVIGLFAMLAAGILFSARFSETLTTLQIAGSHADLSILPTSAVLNAVWVLTLAMTIRYCQVSITVERQYGYLHKLEDAISNVLGDGLYQRESSAYLEHYPAFSLWTWISYVYIFPAVAVIVTLVLITIEWSRGPSGWPQNLLDTALAIAICVTLVLYRLVPIFGRLHRVILSCGLRIGTKRKP